MPFRHVKAAYERLREKEKLELRKYLLGYKGLENAGLKVITGSTAGSGSAHYKKNFDLRNWKWVEITGPDGFNCVVSLNLPAIAPDTKIPIACYDRIGLVLSPEQKDWFDTGIELPLTDKKRRKIAQDILNQYKEYKP